MKPKVAALLLVLFAFAATMLLTACATFGISIESKYGRFKFDPPVSRPIKDK